MGRDEKHLFVGKKLGLSEADVPDFTSVVGQAVLIKWMKEDWPDFEFNLCESVQGAPEKALDAAYAFLLAR